jgi:hypothetical protein
MQTATDIVGIYAIMSSSVLGRNYEQHKPALGKVKLHNSAKESTSAFER